MLLLNIITNTLIKILSSVHRCRLSYQDRLSLNHNPTDLPDIFVFVSGFFIFLFHCLMKENVRKQWRIHLCCGRFKLSGYSGWNLSELYFFLLFFTPGVCCMLIKMKNPFFCLFYLLTSDWSGSVMLGGRAKSVKLAHTPSETTSEQKISRSSQKDEN